MGNTLSETLCVSLEGCDALTKPTYTVERTSGAVDSGWVISESPFKVGRPEWIKMHATKHISEGWRIFMHNNKSDPNLYVCGWRKINTIVPEDQGPDFDLKDWRKNLVNVLEDLELARLEKFPNNVSVNS